MPAATWRTPTRRRRPPPRTRRTRSKRFDRFEDGRGPPGFPAAFFFAHGRLAPEPLPGDREAAKPGGITMRNPLITTALIAGAALALTACNRGSSQANNAVANELDANMTMSEPANDASAMESTANTAEPAAPAANASTNGSDVGGDSGGNNVESNTLGM